MKRVLEIHNTILLENDVNIEEKNKHVQDPDMKASSHN